MTFERANDRSMRRLEQFFGSGLGQAVTIGAMAAWLLVPLGLGVRRFGRKNF